MAKHVSFLPFASSHSSFTVRFVTASTIHKQTKMFLSSPSTYFCLAQNFFKTGFNRINLGKQDIFKMPLGVVLTTQQVIVPSALHPFPLPLTHGGALSVFHVNIIAHWLIFDQIQLPESETETDFIVRYDLLSESVSTPRSESFWTPLSPPLL